MQESKTEVNDTEEISPTVVTSMPLGKLQEIYNEKITKAFDIFRDVERSLAVEEIERNILEDRIENYRSFVSHYCLNKERTQIPDAPEDAGDSLSTAESKEITAPDKVTVEHQLLDKALKVLFEKKWRKKKDKQPTEFYGHSYDALRKSSGQFYGLFWLPQEDAVTMDKEPAKLDGSESVPEGTTLGPASCLGQDPKKSPGFISRIRHALSRKRAKRQRPTRDMYTETSSLPGLLAWPSTQNGDAAC